MGRGQGHASCLALTILIRSGEADGGPSEQIQLPLSMERRCSTLAVFVQYDFYAATVTGTHQSFLRH